MKLVEFDSRSYGLYYVLVSTVYLQLCYQLSSATSVCNTPDCKKLGDYFKKNMNEQGKPCTDFYDYVCRNWGVHNPRPKHKSTWNTSHLLRRSAAAQLKNVLENPHVLKPSKVQYAKALHRECMNTPFMDKADPISVKSVMRAAGYWPTFVGKDTQISELEPWWQIDSYYVSKTGESSIAKLYLTSDKYNKHRITPVLLAPDSAYGMLQIKKPLDAKRKQYYKAFLREVINNVIPYSPTNSVDLSETVLDDVIKFREEIQKISSMEDIYNRTMLIQWERFQNQYNEHVLGHDTAKVEWLALVRALCKNSKDPYLMLFQNKPSSLEIVVYMHYFFQLAAILGRTPKHIIVLHVHLYFAERHLKLTAQMEANLEKSLTGGVTSTDKIRYEPERWLTCVENHNMAYTLGYMYLSSYFPPSSRKEVKNLIDKELLLLKIRISDSSWLDGSTKLKTISKIDKFDTEVGFPEWYFKNRSDVVRTYDDVNPLLPNAYFGQELHRLSVSAAYLQYPIFVPNMPYVVKYGTPGFALAHELTHGVVDKGLEFDEFGHKRTWWPSGMLRRYEVQADCFEQQYKKYKQEELRKRNINEKSISNTVGEDIADAMGLKIAYLGYKLNFQRLNGSCEVLPGFEKYTCEQMFFIVFGNVFCANSTPESEEKTLVNSVHSLGKIRVNGAVGNMKEFHKAFGCKADDPIVPEKMCDIWE